MAEENISPSETQTGGERTAPSDSDDMYVTDISERHKSFIKSILIDLLSESKGYSVQIIHTGDQSAQMVVNFESVSGM